MSDWFIRTPSGTQLGPLSEGDLLGNLRETPDLNGFQVRQGESQWVKAEVAMKQFRDLADHGFYFLHKEKVLGPYTCGRANELVAQNPVLNTFRHGLEGRWMTIGASRRITETSSGPKAPEIASPVGLNDSASSKTQSSQAPLISTRTRSSTTRMNPPQMIGIGCGGCLTIFALLFSITAFSSAIFGFKVPVKVGERIVTRGWLRAAIEKKPEIEIQAELAEGDANADMRMSQAIIGMICLGVGIGIPVLLVFLLRKRSPVPTVLSPNEVTKTVDC